MTADDARQANLHAAFIAVEIARQDLHRARISTLRNEATEANIKAKEASLAAAEEAYRIVLGGQQPLDHLGEDE